MKSWCDFAVIIAVILCSIVFGFFWQMLIFLFFFGALFAFFDATKRLWSLKPRFVSKVKSVLKKD